MELLNADHVLETEAEDYICSFDVASPYKVALILDIHTTEKIAGDDVDGWGFRGDGMCSMIADATDEALAFYLYVDRRGYEEFNAAKIGVYVDFLIFSNHGLT